MSKQVDPLVKLRDALAMASEALNEYIETLAPPEVKEKSWSWDPQKIAWAKAEGTKGPYERYPGQDQKPEATADYENLLKDLQAHGGRLTREGWFFWLFQNGATVGRKKRF